MRSKHVLWRQGFREKDFERLETVLENMDTHKAQVGKDNRDDEKARRSRISWLSSNVWLRERLWSFAEEGNRRNYGFDVTRSCDIQYTEYLAKEKGHYNWHVDVHIDRDNLIFDRKISLTVQLSDPNDYEGGAFEIEGQKLPDWHTEKGTVLIFPSYMKHKVNPVTKGKRRSLVAWFEGPIWR